MSTEPSTAESAKPEESQLSPAEVKKRAKAEKQARRAAQKEQSGGAIEDRAAVAGVNGESSHPNPSAGAGPASQKPRGEKQQQQQQKDPQKHVDQESKKAASEGGQHGSTSTRRKDSQASGLKEQVDKALAAPKGNKQVAIFSHLYSQSRRQTGDGTSKDVDPSILALGFKMSSYEICGSTARCVAMLLAFKDAIAEYTTPTGTSLARHMASHFLSPQIDFLKSCRPLSESMGNAIRWLKNLIVKVDPSTGEKEAKDHLRESIDRFVKERIVLTDQMIATRTSKHIKNGTVVLTYAKSTLVEKILIRAHANGTQFRVIVVDSRPLFEGKRLATTLLRAGLNVKYLPFHGIRQALREATLVLLGAHSVLSNGILLSRVGTAPVALAAFKAAVPVVVCCQSVKFSGKSAFDSVGLNEVAPPEELLLTPPNSEAPAGNQGAEESKVKALHDWKEISNLQMLNVMYDVTPAEHLTLVVCEHGDIPPSSVMVINQTMNEGE